jgi:hypothetical protein
MTSQEIKAEAHRIRSAAAEHHGLKAKEICFISCWNMAKNEQSLPWENEVEIISTTGATVLVELGDNEDELKINVPSVGYTWEGQVINTADPKTNFRCMAGRVGLTAEIVKTLNKEIGFTPWEIPDMTGEVLVFTGDRHVSMTRMERDEYNGF